jgi:heme-degrading monooxygenase HmoA
MLAMQYSIELPIGYDTGLIRSRVEGRARLFKGLPGLVHKSYLLSDTDKIYAPFYIWSDMAEARRFLFDDLFRGVTKTFRRPRVRTWMVLDSVYGNKDFTPSFAIRETDRIAPEDDLEERFLQEKREQDEQAGNEHLHFHAVALDAERWELVRYSLWRDEAHAVMPAADCIQTYEVLHYQGLEQNDF